jgi:hypothetical protein
MAMTSTTRITVSVSAPSAPSVPPSGRISVVSTVSVAWPGGCRVEASISTTSTVANTPAAGK